MCKMSLYHIKDEVICRENEKYIPSDVFFFFFEVTFVYYDISLLQLVFLLSDPSHHPSSQGLPVAPNFVLC